jgi:hypothetical protein
LKSPHKAGFFNSGGKNKAKQVSLGHHPHAEPPFLQPLTNPPKGNLQKAGGYNGSYTFYETRQHSPFIRQKITARLPVDGNKMRFTSHLIGYELGNYLLVALPVNVRKQFQGNRLATGNGTREGLNGQMQVGIKGWRRKELMRLHIDRDSLLGAL